jgi:hypothetical protein
MMSSNVMAGERSIPDPIIPSTISPSKNDFKDKFSTQIYEIIAFSAICGDFFL